MDNSTLNDKPWRKNATILEKVEGFLHRIEATKGYNIYIHTYAEEATAKAKDLDARIARGEKIGSLGGLVISIKDVLCYERHPLSAGSKILGGFRSSFTGTALQRLLDEDVIIIGTVNCDEFAMGSSNEHSVYGPTKNGFDPELVPGGSSGASAVSVQMDTCHLSLGSDTGGSVRQPAAFCGVVGMKPTYGRISRYGLVAYASSFDQIGILSKNIETLAIVLEHMSGVDPMDATSSSYPVEQFSTFSEKDLSQKIVYFKECIEHPGLDHENKRLFSQKIQSLQQEGYMVEEVSFPLIEYLVPTYYVLTTAEASSNLSRYDGVRYGHRTESPLNIQDLYSRTRDEGFGLEVKRRIMLGTFVLSAGYFDAYYVQAQKVRRQIQQYLQELFVKNQFLLMPCAPSAPWKIGAMDKDPVAIYLADVFTVLANLAGLPAASIPYNSIQSTPQYRAVQVMAAPMQEKALLSFVNNSLFLA